jgi:RNA polymerase sigma-70 factor (ECF subfamily)
MADSGPLSALFLAYIPSSEDASADATDLEEQLAALVDAAHRSSDVFQIPTADLLRFIALRFDPAYPIAQLRADDLYHLCAYVLGVPAAAAIVEARYFGPVKGALRRIRASPDLTQDVLQALRCRLLLDRSHDPEHKHYSGAGSLTSWLCVWAVREAGHRRDRRDREELFDEHALTDLPQRDEDQELAYLKHLYREHFKAAFQEALMTLSPRERNVLRYNVLKGLNIAEIGAIYQVHRATVARWIAHARELLRQSTRERLTQRLHAADHELDSILRLIESQMDVSLRRCLDDDA